MYKFFYKYFKSNKGGVLWNVEKFIIELMKVVNVINAEANYIGINFILKKEIKKWNKHN